MIEDIYFEIVDGANIIKIEPLKWNYPDAELDWDKNWIRSRITVKGGAFSGQFYCDLMTTDFELFKRALNKTYNSLNQQAEFNTLESQIQIKIVGDGLGHFTVDCQVVDEVGIGNKLNVEMTFDQTQIPNFIRQLDKIVKQFPIQGTELNLVNE